MAKRQKNQIRLCLSCGDASKAKIRKHVSRSLSLCCGGYLSLVKFSDLFSFIARKGGSMRKKIFQPTNKYFYECKGCNHKLLLDPRKVPEQCPRCQTIYPFMRVKKSSPQINFTCQPVT